MILSLLRPNTYHKQLWYVSYSTILAIIVPLTCPIGAAWTDDLIKCHLDEENKIFGMYGRVDVYLFTSLFIRFLLIKTFVCYNSTSSPFVEKIIGTYML